jgi:hypothetical protein
VELIPLRIASYAFARQVILFDAKEQIALDNGVVTQEEIQRWHASLEQAESQDAFFGSMTLMLVVGQKP